MNYDPSRHTAVSCNLCGWTDAGIVFPAGVAQVNQIVRCACGLMYASPRRDPDVLDIESWANDPTFDYERERPQRVEKERLQVRDYARTLAALAELHPERGQLVEVGSSMGFLLDSFRRNGWSVLGVEPDRNGNRVAMRHGLDTITATLEDARLPSSSADVLVMLHVIEHVPDPVSTLREAFRVLRPGGTVVLETPRYDTLAFRLLRHRDRSISCDGHIYFFTRDTLRRAYEAAGFELLEFERVGRSMTLDRLLYNVAVLTKREALKRWAASGSRRLGLHQVSLRLNVGDVQRVTLRKPAGAEAVEMDRTG